MTELSIDEIIKEGLAGNPVKLKNGEKAYVLADHRKLKDLKKRDDLTYFGFVLGANESVQDYLIWNEKGVCVYNVVYSIASLWEDEYKDQSELFEHALEDSLLLGGCDVDGKYIEVAIVGKLKDGKYIAQQQGGPLKTVYEFCVPEFEIIPRESEIENNAYYPEHGDTYWYVTFDYGRPMVKCAVFDHSQTSINRREHKNCYRTKENAEAVIKKTGMLIYE